MSEQTNESRAELAFRTLLLFSQYAGMDGEDVGTQATDLIADLLHLADQYGYGVTDIMERAHDHYEEEVREARP